MENWLSASWSLILQTILTVFAIYTIVVVFVRFSGLRTFAKMSSFDFASTVAMGSIIATIIMNNDISLIKGAVALGSIMVFQQVFAGLKIRVDRFADLTENNPTLLMDGARFLEENLRRTGVSKSDVYAKLREANVIRMEQIKAVVLETTGDISVLHGEGDKDLEDEVLQGVTR